MENTKKNQKNVASMKKNKLILILGIISFLSIVFYSYMSQVTEYISDALISIAITLFIFSFRKKLNLTHTSFILIILALLFHDLGVFGFYNASPIVIQYDHFTHFFGLFAISIIIFNLLKQYFTKSNVTNFIILLVMFASSLGIGSLVEQVEYIGYLKFGTGPGLLRFGGYGDTPFNESDLRAMDIIGGGWINTMLDLNYNFLGAIIGAIFMYIKYLSTRDGRSKIL